MGTWYTKTLKTSFPVDKVVKVIEEIASMILSNDSGQIDDYMAEKLDAYPTYLDGEDEELDRYYAHIDVVETLYCAEITIHDTSEDTIVISGNESFAESVFSTKKLQSFLQTLGLEGEIEFVEEEVLC